MLTDSASRYYGELEEMAFVEKPGDLESAMRKVRRAVKPGSRYVVVVFKREDGPDGP